MIIGERMKRKFKELFGTLKLDTDLEAALEGAYVTRLAANREQTVLRVYLQLDRLLPKRRLRTLESLMGQQLSAAGQATSLHIIESYSLPQDMTPEQAYSEYKDSCLEELEEAKGLLFRVFKKAELDFSEEGKVLVCLEDNILSHNQEDELEDYLLHVFNTRLGFELRVDFSYRQAAASDSSAHREARLAHRIQEIEARRTAAENQAQLLGDDSTSAPSSAASNTSNNAVSNATGNSTGNSTGGTSGNSSGRSWSRENPSRSDNSRIRPLKRSSREDVIYEREFEGEHFPIQDIQGEIGEVIVRGQIIAIDERTLRDGQRALVTFAVTDFTDTINAKVFVAVEQLGELYKGIRKGAFVKIKATPKLDDYDHELSLQSIRGIMSIPDFTTKRIDLAPTKRVELHCHTKMSDMDGVSDASALLEQAADWGHPALAITDHGVVQAFPEADHTVHDLKKAGKPIKVIYGCEIYLVDDVGEGVAPDDINAIKSLKTYHCIVLAKNDIGRINLYRLVSESHLQYFKRRPRVPKSLLTKHREGLIIGSACEAGEVFKAVLAGKSEEEQLAVASFYDYLEIQPTGNNAFMLRGENPKAKNMEELREFNRQIVRLGDKLGKPTCATCDVHFLDPEDEIYRRILMAGKGFKDADDQAPLYLRTTEEMLDEFDYLGYDKAYEVVVTNTNLIANMCETIAPVRPDKCPPVIENSDQDLRKICYDKAHEIYGDDLPEIVESRLERELTSIIGNGYAVMYIIAQKLVWKSNEDGYLVGSRGSVGSSFVATMAGITEVNPLSPHYVCPSCHFVDFDSEQVKAYAGHVGCDMPDRDCPNCGTKLKKDGFDIPFETFLGFKGDKEPDIDLNFSGDYQGKAHRYTEVIFGKGHTFKAGTIGGIQDKTAFGYIRKYYEERQIHKRSCEIGRIVTGCLGVRNTTGQHPGGIIVLPMGEEIHTFTPIQHPANKDTDIITTHFDYHSIDSNLLKLDILGHDDPTMIRRLQDLTNIPPQDIPLDDPKVLSLFEGTEALGVTPEELMGCEMGTLGIPEFGTDFAMGMLRDAKPKEVTDLICISGLSHGTDVWLGNAKDLIESGTATISTCISTRDDIMTYLIHMGLDPARSFKIMELVRKGTVAKGKAEGWDEFKADMLDHGVPEWYVDSCQKIKYMFPKAHAAAYVMMALRIGYCKVYYPLAYYAAFFSIRAKNFNYEIMCQGKEQVEVYIRGLNAKVARKEDLTAKEEGLLRDARIVQEMYARGFEFLPMDLYASEAKDFKIVDGKLLPPFSTIDGMGDTAAEGLARAAAEKTFLSKEDVAKRGGVSRTVVDTLERLGVISGLPESNQYSFFDLMKGNVG